MFNDGNITRFNEIAFLQQFFIDSVDRFFSDPFHRKFWPPILFFYPNDKIAATPIVNVIGESTNGMDDGLCIPVLLVVHTSAVYDPTVDQVINVDR